MVKNHTHTSGGNNSRDTVAGSRRELAFLFLAFFTLLIFLVLPSPANLSTAGQRSLGIFSLALILWVTNALPLSVTGLLVIALIPLLRVMKAEQAYSFFGNSAVFFILGAFIMASATIKSGLSKRTALAILTHFSHSPRILILGILITCGFMALIIPEHAVAALMFPVVGTIALSLDSQPRESQYGTGLFLAMSWGSVIGGVGTLLGGARAPLAVGMLQEAFHQSLSFWGWSRVALPLVGITLIVAYAILIFGFNLDIADVRPARKKLEEELREIGPMTLTEKKVLVILTTTILIWIIFNHWFEMAMVSLFSAVTLFIAKVITWDDVNSYVNWGVILMYGGAIVIAKAVDQTGAARWIAHQLLSRVHLAPLWTIGIFSLFSFLLTEGISNVACVAIILPIGFSICRANAINPLAMVFGVAVPAGLPFILPMGSPANAIAYSSGYYDIRDIIKAGIILHICCWIIFLILVKWYWPLVGVSL
ncbi:MAG: DASS family sodium-coupled anion symporter [bacterium]